jgi:hypothetical protein
VEILAFLCEHLEPNAVYRIGEEDLESVSCGRRSLGRRSSRNTMSAPR